MKQWYKSKTIIFNGIVAALVALEASIGMLKPIMGEHSYAVIAALLPVLNVFLRTITTDSIGKESKELSNEQTPDTKS